MPRQTYQLSEQTRAVLANNQQRIAAEMDVEDKYIYGILSEANPDSYPKFRRLFRAAANACAPVEFWLDDLTAIAKRAKRGCEKTAREIGNLLVEKIRTDALSTERLIAANADGTLDGRECHEILAIADKYEAIAANLRATAHARLGELIDDEPAAIRFTARGTM